MTCEVCSNPLRGRQTRFCSRRCKGKLHQSYPAQAVRGLQRKLEIVAALGGRCSVCGYAKNLAALTFHHREGDTKDFGLDMRAFSNRTFEVIASEVAKCALLCTNCHAELHNPDLTMERLLARREVPQSDKVMDQVEDVGPEGFEPPT